MGEKQQEQFVNTKCNWGTQKPGNIDLLPDQEAAQKRAVQARCLILLNLSKQEERYIFLMYNIHLAALHQFHLPKQTAGSSKHHIMWLQFNTHSMPTHSGCSITVWLNLKSEPAVGSLWLWMCDCRAAALWKGWNSSDYHLRECLQQRQKWCD